jgi:hypothetical protein
MAVKRAQFERQLKHLRSAFAGLSSWRVKGAMLVAALGFVALVILAASRPAEPVALTAAMEAEYDESRMTAPELKKARAKRSASGEQVVSSPAPMSSDESSVIATGGQDSAVVTLTGCLEQDDDVFRLKDAEGLNAPKSRSWKSGFLKKKSAKVEVVDASSRLRLKNHVGRRVSVTGMLYERELLANSVKRVAASCN